MARVPTALGDDDADADGAVDVDVDADGDDDDDDDGALPTADSNSPPQQRRAVVHVAVAYFVQKLIFTLP